MDLHIFPHLPLYRPHGNTRHFIWLVRVNFRTYACHAIARVQSISQVNCSGQRKSILEPKRPEKKKKKRKKKVRWFTRTKRKWGWFLEQNLRVTHFQPPKAALSVTATAIFFTKYNSIDTPLEKRKFKSTLTKFMELLSRLSTSSPSSSLFFFRFLLFFCVSRFSVSSLLCQWARQVFSFKREGKGEKSVSL